MKTLILVALAATLSLSVAGSAEAQKIKNCSPEATADIRAAVRILENNMHRLTNPPVDLGKKRQRKKILRKMPKKLRKLVITCNARRKCLGGKNWDGKDRWGNHALVRQVRICYDSYVAHPTATFCNFVGTVAHEYAHRLGFPKSQHHNNTREYPSAREDSVYRFGYWVRDEICKQAGFDRPLAAELAHKPLFSRLRERRRR
ncbi:MAG: hypothetical protein KJO07_16185 [Deltaproteobacteria bacterium]|nr:hypothetical protein [Deltaproteobacteria bacterium]